MTNKVFGTKNGSFFFTGLIKKEVKGSAEQTFASVRDSFENTVQDIEEWFEE